MSNQTVSAKQKDGPETSVEYNFGDTLEEAVELFGADVVFSRFKGAAVVDLQAMIRRLQKAGKTDKEIQEHCAQWKPSVGRASGPRKTKEERLAELLSQMSPEERKRAIAAAREAAKADS